MSWKTNSVTLLHIELSTHCNAACPLCLRYYNSSTIVRPDLRQTSISLDQFKQYFTEKFLSQLKRIIYCGTMGDPLMARDCYEILAYVNELNPTCQQTFHTNGGIRSLKFWAEMGRLFSRPNMKLIFSIDGLEDTNHIYRRNVEWSKLIANVSEFINNGGNAEWEYLVFDHNDHQVELARQLSIDIGFKSFVFKRPTGFETKDNLYKSREVYDSQGRLEYQIYPTRKLEYNNGKRIKINSLVDSVLFDEKYPVDLKLVDEVKEKGYFPLIKQRLDNFDPNKTLDMGTYKFDLDSREVLCHSLHQQGGEEIYVNAEGQVFPCCFVGTRYDARLISYVDDQLKIAVNPYKEQLNLNSQNIEEVLASNLFEKIFESSWSKPTLEQGKMALCAETCSKNSWFNLLYINKDKQHG